MPTCGRPNRSGQTISIEQHGHAHAHAHACARAAESCPKFAKCSEKVRDRQRRRRRFHTPKFHLSSSFISLSLHCNKTKPLLLTLSLSLQFDSFHLWRPLRTTVESAANSGGAPSAERRRPLTTALRPPSEGRTLTLTLTTLLVAIMAGFQRLWFLLLESSLGAPPSSSVPSSRSASRVPSLSSLLLQVRFLRLFVGSFLD